MREELLAIGKMAKLSRISITTLRLYDEKGLLKPRYVDPDTGYRYYSIDQNARLDMIAYMRELGMSLAEIGQVLSRENITLIEELLAEKNEQIRRQIRQMEARRDAVERAIQSIERYRKSPTTGTLSLEYIDRRWAWGIPCLENFYARGIGSYEASLQALRRTLAEQGLEQLHSYNIGTTIRKEDFAAGQFIAEQIFLLAGQDPVLPGCGLHMVDSGMYACIYLDNYDDEVSGAHQLLEHCRRSGYRIAGDYICEVMTGFNVFDSDPRRMFLRLQVPVNFAGEGEK